VLAARLGEADAKAAFDEAEQHFQQRAQQLEATELTTRASHNSRTAAASAYGSQSGSSRVTAGD
jgi:hypothetical protein